MRFHGIVFICLLQLNYIFCGNLKRNPLENGMQSSEIDNENFKQTYRFQPIAINHIDPVNKIHYFNITYLVENAMNHIKKYMKTGNKAYRIPKLDPFHFNEKHVIYKDALKLHGKVTGEMKNLSKIKWSHLYACLFSLVWQVDFILTDITVNGHYKLNGSVYDIFPLYGSGKYTFKIQKLNATLTTQFVPQRGDQPIHIALAKVNLNMIKGMKWNLGGALGCGTLSKVVNNFTNDISAAVIKRIMGLIEIFFSGVLGLTVGDALAIRNITAIDVVRYLQSFPNAAQPVIRG